ncbi:MAG: NAD-dependent protein deacylase, partial [Oscillospiraceae bacterium]
TYYHGKKLVLINKMSTPYDAHANLIINENIGEVFAQV